MPATMGAEMMPGAASSHPMAANPQMSVYQMAPMAMSGSGEMMGPSSVGQMQPIEESPECASDMIQNGVGINRVFQSQLDAYLNQNAGHMASQDASARDLAYLGRFGFRCVHIFFKFL